MPNSYYVEILVLSTTMVNFVNAVKGAKEVLDDLPLFFRRSKNPRLFFFSRSSFLEKLYSHYVETLVLIVTMVNFVNAVKEVREVLEDLPR